MNSITLERAAMLPGEVLRGTVAWSIDHPPRKLELRAFWHSGEYGKGDARTIATHPQGDAQEGQANFAFELPELPWSVEGQVVKVTWAVELVEKKSGSLALADFIMSGDGQVVTLGKVDKPLTESSSSLRMRR